MTHLKIGTIIKPTEVVCLFEASVPVFFGDFDSVFKIFAFFENIVKNYQDLISFQI